MNGPLGLDDLAALSGGVCSSYIEQVLRDETLSARLFLKYRPAVAESFSPGAWNSKCRSDHGFRVSRTGQVADSTAANCIRGICGIGRKGVDKMCIIQVDEVDRAG